MNTSIPAGQAKWNPFSQGEIALKAPVGRKMELAVRRTYKNKCLQIACRAQARPVRIERSSRTIAGGADERIRFSYCGSVTFS
jgi:hypothetical protein